MSYEMNGDYALAYETFIKQQEKDENVEDYKRLTRRRAGKVSSENTLSYIKSTKTNPELISTA